MLIDTHCHLNLLESFPDPAASIAEAVQAGVEKLVVIGIDIESSRRAVELADRHKEVYASVGLHPNSASEYCSRTLADLEPMLSHPKTVAIGEIGLDYHWDYATKDQQRTALFDQLDLAASIGKPVVFHCREAYKDLLPLLAARARHPGVLHCFAGDAEDASLALELRLMFGVDGPITYKKANDLREIFRTLPADRIVIETDAPYLTPEPHRGKPNRPAYVAMVNAGLAACRGIGRDECARLTTANATRFFGL